MWGGELQLTAVGGVFWVVGVGFGITWGCCAVRGVLRSVCPSDCMYTTLSLSAQESM